MSACHTSGPARMSPSKSRAGRCGWDKIANTCVYFETRESIHCQVICLTAPHKKGGPENGPNLGAACREMVRVGAQKTDPTFQKCARASTCAHVARAQPGRHLLVLGRHAARARARWHAASACEHGRDERPHVSVERGWAWCLVEVDTCCAVPGLWRKTCRADACRLAQSTRLCCAMIRRFTVVCCSYSWRARDP